MDPDVAGNAQLRNRFLHLLDSLPQADAFKAAGHGDVALQILAADFRLARLLFDSARAFPRLPFFPWN